MLSCCFSDGLRVRLRQLDRPDRPFLPRPLVEGGVLDGRAGAGELAEDPVPFEEAFAPLLGKFDQWFALDESAEFRSVNLYLGEVN